mmetsp:Transcript_14678/g.38147  ORF Transcript_14678/g.38147 Transcript_14678/m.38147 type:complete len:255 (+) Transcript_14678:1345-2109(+)
MRPIGPVGVASRSTAVAPASAAGLPPISLDADALGAATVSVASTFGTASSAAAGGFAPTRMHGAKDTRPSRSRRSSRTSRLRKNVNMAAAETANDEAAKRQKNCTPGMSTLEPTAKAETVVMAVVRIAARDRGSTRGGLGCSAGTRPKAQAVRAVHVAPLLCGHAVARRHPQAHVLAACRVQLTRASLAEGARNALLERVLLGLSVQVIHHDDHGIDLHARDDQRQQRRDRCERHAECTRDTKASAERDDHVQE